MSSSTSRRLHPLTIALSGADQRALAELAEQCQTTRSSVARELICAGLEVLYQRPASIGTIMPITERARKRQERERRRPPRRRPTNAQRSGGAFLAQDVDVGEQQE